MLAKFGEWLVTKSWTGFRLHRLDGLQILEQYGLKLGMKMCLRAPLRSGLGSRSQDSGQLTSTTAM